MKATELILLLIEQIEQVGDKDVCAYISVDGSVEVGEIYDCSVYDNGAKQSAGIVVDIKINYSLKKKGK